MKINQLKIFDNLAVLARSSIFNDSLGNKKTKPYLSMIPYIEFIILPVDLEIGGKGSLTKIMKECCSMDCRFLPNEIKPLKFQGNKQYCNQNRAVNHWIDQINRLKNQGNIKSLELTKYQARLTTFGDICRLNKEGKEYILSVLKNSTSHLGYSAGWRQEDMKAFQGLLQASVGDLAEAMEAYNLGFMPYGLSRQDNLTFRVLTGNTAYACPYDTTSLKGCSVCEIRCNGQKAISLKEKRNHA